MPPTLESDIIVYNVEKPLCEGMYGPCPFPGEEISCRTRYGDERDANPILCAFCAEEYNKHWDDMWNEYYSSVL